MLKFIASDLKLQKLTLGVEALDFYADLFEGIQKNNYLKELKFVGEIHKWLTVKQIIEQFPGIECLTFSQTQSAVGNFALMISTILKIKVNVDEGIQHSEFNYIPDVHFYINASNIQEVEVIQYEAELARNRINNLREVEKNEAV